MLPLYRLKDYLPSKQVPWDILEAKLYGHLKLGEELINSKSISTLKT